MKPLPERLNDRLEREGKRTRNGGEAPGWLASPLQAESPDPEVDELVTLARHVQSHPHLHANPDFADLLASVCLSSCWEPACWSSRHRSPILRIRSP